MIANKKKTTWLLGWLLPLLCFSCNVQTAPVVALNVRDVGGLPRDELVRDILFSPDAKRLLILLGKTGASGSAAYVWNMFQPKNSLIIDASVPIVSAVWSPDGSSIVTGVEATGKDSVILVWNASDGGKLREIKVTFAGSMTKAPAFNRLSFSPDGKFLFAEAEQIGKFFVWGYENESVKPAIVSGRSVVPYGSGYAYIDGDRIGASAGADTGSAYMKGVRSILPTADGGLLVLNKNPAGDQLCLLRGAKLEEQPGACPVYADIQAWYPSEDGSRLLLVERPSSGGGPGRVVFLPDTSQPGQVVELGPAQDNEQVLLSPGGGRYVHNVARASSDSDGALGLYLKDARTGKDVVELDAWAQATLAPWRFSSNGNRFAATLGAPDGQGGTQIRVWDVKGL